MPDETNDQVGNEGASANISNQKEDGPKVQERTSGQGMDGQVSAQGAANATDRQDADAAAQSEEEPVGSRRPESRPVRKMSASDFKVKSEPKPEPRPAAPAPAPAQQTAVQPRPEPRPEPRPAAPTPAPAQQTAVQPKPEQRREPIASSRPPNSPPETIAVEPEPTWEPVKESVKEPARTNYAVPQPEYKRAEEPQRPEPTYDNVPPGGFMDAIKGALSFFTIIPINVGGKEIQALNKSFYVAPVAGLVVGIIAAVFGIIFNELRVAAMAPVAAIATAYIMSKFLHFDGLVDFGDGMVASGDKESCIKALKDTRVGAGGIGIALIVVISIYAGLRGIWSPFALSVVIVAMEVFAKNAMVATAAFGEPGTGMASEQVRNTGFNTMLTSTAVSAALAFAGYLLIGVIVSLVITTGMLNSTLMISAALIIVCAAVSSIAVGWLIAFLSNKKFGFVNGDVLGAANEISKISTLFVSFIVIMFYTASQLNVIWL